MSDTWFTPKSIIDSLGPFDFDPCTSINRPFDTATVMCEDGVVNGLHAPWFGFVWMNPPYSKPGPWMDKMAAHNNGIALIKAGYNTHWWHDNVVPYASVIAMTRGRINFINAHHQLANNNQYETLFVGYGNKAACRLIREKERLKLSVWGNKNV